MTSTEQLSDGHELSTKPRTELITPPELARKFEQAGYIKEAPRLADQIADPSRTNRFQYIPRDRGLFADDPQPTEAPVELTEHEGLKHLQEFLAREVTAGTPHSEVARDIVENLTFIGQKEYQEAAQGLGDYWRSYLDDDPSRQLCVVIEKPNAKTPNKRKSSSYLLDSILANFSEAELDKYQGRIVTELDQITTPPDQTKVVMLDDWSISGTQMRTAHDRVINSGHSDYANSVEINLMVATQEQVQEGLDNQVWDWQTQQPGDAYNIPVRGYFLAHAAPDPRDEFRAHVTGAHSSVDYGFELHIQSMVKDRNARGEPTEMPPLTNILRSYRYAERQIQIQPDGKIIHLSEAHRHAEAANTEKLHQTQAEERAAAARERIASLETSAAADIPSEDMVESTHLEQSPGNAPAPPRQSRWDRVKQRLLRR